MAARLLEDGMRFKNSWNAASLSVLGNVPAAPPMRKSPPTRSSMDMLRVTLPMAAESWVGRGRGPRGEDHKRRGTPPRSVAADWVGWGKVYCQVDLCATVESTCHKVRTWAILAWARPARTPYAHTMVVDSPLDKHAGRARHAARGAEAGRVADAAATLALARQARTSTTPMAGDGLPAQAAEAQAGARSSGDGATGSDSRHAQVHGDTSHAPSASARRAAAAAAAEQQAHVWARDMFRVGVVSLCCVCGARACACVCMCACVCACVRACL